mmetsp:Transcript_59148/g.106342  ORF Transcript_59148/g.106342 Transcript_59148/m.106342 type:complete len:225 (+) Transcript_59148:150-824(+)
MASRALDSRMSWPCCRTSSSRHLSAHVLQLHKRSASVPRGGAELRPRVRQLLPSQSRRRPPANSLSSRLGRAGWLTSSSIARLRPKIARSFAQLALPSWASKLPSRSSCWRLLSTERGVKRRRLRDSLPSCMPRPLPQMPRRQLLRLLKLLQSHSASASETCWTRWANWSAASTWRKPSASGFGKAAQRARQRHKWPTPKPWRTGCRKKPGRPASSCQLWRQLS